MHIPKYCHHKSSDQAYLTWRGKQVYLGRYNTQESREAYRAFLAEHVLASRPEAPEAATVVTPGSQLATLLKGYLEFLKAAGRESEYAHVKRLGWALVRTRYHAWRIKDFGPIALEEFRDLLVAFKFPTPEDLKKRSTQWSRPYINRQVDRLRHVFRWGVRREMLSAEKHLSLMSLPRLRVGSTSAPEGREVLPVDPAHIDAVTPYMASPLRALVTVLRLTGMRPDEGCSMRLCDLDRRGKVWLYHPATHKGEWRGIDREVYLGPHAQQAIKPFLERDPQAVLFSPAEAMNEKRAKWRAERKTKVQPSQRNRRHKRKPKRVPGDRYTTASLRRAVRYAIKQANRERPLDQQIPRWHPYQLRHTRGTEVRHLYSLEASQVVLGHARADVTQIYAERDKRLALKVASEIG